MRRAIVNLQSAIDTRRACCSNVVHPVKATNVSRSGQNTEISPLKVQELVQAEKVILGDLQHHHFGFAIQSLKNLNGNSDKFQDRNTARRRKEVLKKTSCLYKLDPFVDGDGLLRIGGRIRRAAIPPEVKHSLILPKSSHVTDLIVRHFHSKIGHHQGRGITHNAIRQAGYWIIDGRSSVARIISKCVTCRRLRSRPLTQKMSDLPEERVSPTAPFHYTGMDVFGPFYIKEGRVSLKRYGLIFTSLTSRVYRKNDDEDDEALRWWRRWSVTHSDYRSRERHQQPPTDCREPVRPSFARTHYTKSSPDAEISSSSPSAW